MQDYIRIKPTRGSTRHGVLLLPDRPGDWLYKARAMRARRQQLLEYKLREQRRKQQTAAPNISLWR